MPEVEVSSEMKMQANENGSNNGDQMECWDCKISKIFKNEQRYFLLNYCNMFEIFRCNKSM